MTSTTLREMLVKQEPRNVSYCYVCSGPRAEYPLFSKSYGQHPFFPFLEHHQPPEGAESMRSDGRVLTCLVCYTFLSQQWETYEKSKTPQNKRIYWLKRSDGGPFAGMDLNMQQDYESLFETSNTGVIETDIRPKQKQGKSHYPSVGEAKPKINDRPEPVYPSSFNLSSHSNDRTEAPSGNILDLSLPARTPSRTSNSSSPAINLDVCYMCGQESKSVISIFAKPIGNCPYFPSIAMHSKPPNAKPMDSSGKVYACEGCYGVLLQQWDYYQRKNVPHTERIYQLRIISNVNTKSEDLVSKTFICYTCGMEAQTSVQRFIFAFPDKNGGPHFSFLLNITPHPGANKLVNGKAAVCSLCYKTLFRQLKVFELSDTPEDKRKYKILNESVTENFSVLRQHLKSGGESQEAEPKYCCYLCENVAELISVNTLLSTEMYFPFIRNLPKPANALPIDDDGYCKICYQCHKSLAFQFQTFERSHIPLHQRQYKIYSKLLGESHPDNSIANAGYSSIVSSDEVHDFTHRAPDTCSLCAQPLVLENSCFIDTVPQESNMYFPSLTRLVKPNTKAIDQYGRVLACNQCYLILKKQWEFFETAHIPHSQRVYEILPPQIDRAHFSSEIHLPNSNTALHIQVSSPELKVDLSKHSNVEPLLTTVNTLSVPTITSTNASASNSPQIIDLKPKLQSSVEEPNPRITGPLDVPVTRPMLLAPIYCFVCSELNVSGLTYAIKSLPTTPVGVEKPPEEVPFFPFLTKHTSPEGEKLRNDGSALVCMFCYYSLMSQWLAYESSPYPEDGNRWHRRYNTHNYVCYICGITTYRKRVCTISVKDFPFLLEHLRPPGALTVLNGEYVVTCQTCFESITSQWKDFERMKVPVEMRKYNWIVMPPPPDDENSRGCQILVAENCSASNFSQPDVDQTHLEDGLSSGLKPPPSHLAPTPYNFSKPVGRNAVSPVHQSSHAFSPFAGGTTNPAMNATRTSSFAAALRKLAKQAVDPIAEKELSPISPASSPSSSQQSSHSRHHAALPPMYLNSHGSNPVHISSPPVGSVPPVSSSQGKLTALDLGRYSSSSRNGSLMEPVSLKVDSSKLSEKRSDTAGNNKQIVSSMPLNLRHEQTLPSRGFQPYRNSEDHHSTPPQAYNPSPPPSSYSYHPSFAQPSQLPHQSYRLEEPVYVERYGLLRPSSMSYQPSSNLLPHPRVPLYPSSHYPPDLLPHSMRSASSSSAAYAPRYIREDSESGVLKKHEMEAYHRERERYAELEEREYRNHEAEFLRKERTLRQSPVHYSHVTARAESSNDDKGHMGSITQGTPRDFIRRISPPVVSVPLNLATNAESEIAAEEEAAISSKLMKYRNKSVINGQVPLRNASHPSSALYRKDGEATPYRMQYQVSENHPKHPPAESNTSSGPSKLILHGEREPSKPDIIETRTLSMASVINSQINGIFAREKFISNNSYDYLNSFHPEKNLFADSCQKSSHESFAQGSKSAAKSSPQESSSFDSHSNKPAAYVPSSHQGYDASSCPPPLRAKEPSITKALLQSSFSSYDSEMHVFEEQFARVVSVLDKREEKLKELRENGEMLDSDYSDPDSDEEDTERIKQILKLTKGPSPKIKNEPEKVKFLATFNLVTYQKKNMIELQKCVRRHKILREKSVSPVELEEPVKSPDVEYDPAHLYELSKRLCLENNFEAKAQFLNSLGLKFLSPEEKAEKERLQKLVVNERLRRNGLLSSSQLQLESQEKDAVKPADLNTTSSSVEEELKKSPITVESNKNELNKNLTKKNSVVIKPPTKPYSNLARSTFLKPTRTGNASFPLPVPPLIPANQVIPTVTEPARETSTSVVAPKDPRVRQLNKEFAQEFHNSVLQATLAEKKVFPSPHALDSSLKQPAAPVLHEKMEVCFEGSHQPMGWPGIESIMESYECHIQEQNVEKKFLLRNCQKLKASQVESNKEIECLGKRTEELVHEKNLLESERRELQRKIESYRLLIQHFR